MSRRGIDAPPGAGWIAQRLHSTARRLGKQLLDEERRPEQGQEALGIEDMPMMGIRIASGFVGANYSNNTASLSANAGTGSALIDDNGDASADFGFSLGYLWRSVAGAEFLAGFTPNFEVQNNFANINNGDRPK